MALIDRLLNKEDFTKSFDELQKSYRRLAEQFEEQKKTTTILAEDLLQAEEERDLLKTDPEQYIEREVERRLLTLEEELKENMNHKWYCVGRQDAYAEMGIRVLDAKKRGDQVEITLDEDGKIDGVTEVINDIDKYCNEIEIDDLVDVQ